MLGARQKEKTSRTPREALSNDIQERGEIPGSEDTSIHSTRQDVFDTADLSLSRHSVRSPTESMDSLKKNIENNYGLSRQQAEKRSSYDNDFVLGGQPFEVPYHTLKDSLPSGPDRRSDDENKTFRAFAGLESLHGPTSLPVALDVDVQSVPQHQGPSNDKRNSSLTHVSSRYESNAIASPKSSARSTPVNTPSPVPVRQETSRRSSVDVSDPPSARASPKVSTPTKVKPSAMSTKLPDHYTEDQLLRTFNINGLRVTLYYGNLLIEETDAIVNASNESLEHYGGIAYAILKARGREMDEECRRHITRHGKLKTTEVMHTTGGGDIKASHIIHAAGPMWLSEHFKDRFTAQLITTFLNCLKYADGRLWIKSLALPVISSGKMTFFYFFVIFTTII